MPRSFQGFGIFRRIMEGGHAMSAPTIEIKEKSEPVGQWLNNPIAYNGWYWVIYQLRSLPPKEDNPMVGQKKVQHLFYRTAFLTKTNYDRPRGEVSLFLSNHGSWASTQHQPLHGLVLHTINHYFCRYRPRQLDSGINRSSGLSVYVVFVFSEASCWVRYIYNINSYIYICIDSRAQP